MCDAREQQYLTKRVVLPVCLPASDCKDHPPLGQWEHCGVRGGRRPGPGCLLQRLCSVPSQRSHGTGACAYVAVCCLNDVASVRVLFMVSCMLPLAAMMQLEADDVRSYTGSEASPLRAQLAAHARATMREQHNCATEPDVRAAIEELVRHTYPPWFVGACVAL